MSEADVLRHEFANFRSKRGLPPSRLPPGGDGPYDSGMEARVASLEAKMDKVFDTLGAIQVTLAEIKATMATKDEVNKLALDVAYMKGRVESLPTLPKLSALLAVFVGVGTFVLGVYHHGITAHWW